MDPEYKNTENPVITKQNVQKKDKYRNFILLEHADIQLFLKLCAQTFSYIFSIFIILYREKYRTFVTDFK